jgi:hypothetical protein
LEENDWRRCSACKKPIGYRATYWTCNVSTCNRARTGLVFCTVTCWEVHLPSANHREAWAVERKAPSREQAAEGGGRGGAMRAAPAPKPSGGDDVLVVASRLKDYVRRKSGFNTSDRVLEPLSKIVRKACEEAILNASREGRRTILDRDVPKV